MAPAGLAAEVLEGCLGLVAAYCGRGGRVLSGNAGGHLPAHGQDLAGPVTPSLAGLDCQAVDQLMARPRIVMIDEVDYLTYDARVIETLRDLHDITGAPFVFIGMDKANQKLIRYRHLYDRFTEIMEFQPLDKEDISRVATELTDLKFEPDAMDYISRITGGKIRQVIIAIHRAEKKARVKNLKTVSAKDLN